MKKNIKIVDGVDNIDIKKCKGRIIGEQSGKDLNNFMTLCYGNNIEGMRKGNKIIVLDFETGYVGVVIGQTKN